MKRKILIPGFALAILTACNSSNTRTTDNDTVVTDANAPVAVDTVNTNTVNTETDTSKMVDFLTEAAGGGMMEVELGKLAKTHAANKAVVDFGNMMVRDHSNANAELKSLAAKKNINIPTVLPEKLQKHIDDLSKKTGTDFDKDYMSMMVDDHKDDIDLFEKCTKKDSEDPDVKAFAAKTLPTLRKHLEAAQNIKDKL